MSALLSPERKVAGMKMYSKEGQEMVDMKKLERDGADLVITAKLMGAYSMKIYLKPEEVRAGLKLLSWRVIRYMPLMLIRGFRASKKK
jgi:hypothetical protein